MAKKELVTKAESKESKIEGVISFAYRGKKYSSIIQGKLILHDMGLQEIKDRLNDIPGKFAFWKSLQVTVEREIEGLKEGYDLWYAAKYSEVKEGMIVEGDKKPTEGAIKNMVMLDNLKEYKAQQFKMRDLREVASQIGVLTKAYDMQSWTLGTIAGLTAKEMGNIEAHGKRSISGLGRGEKE